MKFGAGCVYSASCQLNQYSETNVMHFLFNLLRIKGLYMFRALLAHPQEVRHKQHLVYCVRVMSVDRTRIEVELRSTPTPVAANWHNTHAICQVCVCYITECAVCDLVSDPAVECDVCIVARFVVSWMLLCTWGPVLWHCGWGWGWLGWWAQIFMT
jgi:hypothetical protein